MIRKRKKFRSKRSEATDYRSIKDKIKPVGSFDPEIKMVCYGKAGTGKTTLAETFPKPILLIDISEKGTDSIRKSKGVDVLRATEWSDLTNAYWYVRQEKKYKTLVIDTCSNCQDLAVKEVIGEVDGIGWGTLTRQQWGQISGMMKSLFLDMRDLDGVNVVFIAHDRVFNIGEESDEGDGQIQPEVGPRLMPSVASALNAAVGIIGNCFIREKTKDIKIGKKTVTKRRVDYCMRVGPHSYYITKIRKPKAIVAPAFIVDPDYKKIVAAINGELDD